METNDRKQNTPIDVTPLLRSIAEEMVVRSHAILELESRIESIRALHGRGSEQEDLLTPALVTHRRELRLAEKELKRLGWRRDKHRPLRFLSEKRDGGQETEWRLDETGFYRSLGSAQLN